MVLGLVAAGVVYWLGTRAANLADDPSMAGYFKAEKRQRGMLYGKEGVLMDDMLNGLKQPDTQAFLIVVATVIMAAGCFYFARILEEEAQAAEPPGPLPD